MSDTPKAEVKREDGWYWAKDLENEWGLVWWGDGNWYLAGNSIPWQDEDFAEIGERVTRDGK